MSVLNPRPRGLNLPGLIVAAIAILIFKACAGPTPPPWPTDVRRH